MKIASNSKYDNFYKNNIILSIKLIILFTSLYVNRHVYEFRINQEFILKVFISIALTLFIINFIISEIKSFYLTKINISIFCFILIMTSSLLRSSTIILSLQDYIIFLSYLILFFLIANNVNSKKQIFAFVKIIFFTAFIVSLYTIIQYYGFDFYLKNINDITSTIGQKNWVSNYLAMVFPITFCFFLLEKIKKNKIIYYFLLSIIYTSITICQSRGIWISCILTLLIGIYIVFKFKVYTYFKDNKSWLIILLITFSIISIIYSTDNIFNKNALTLPERAISTFDIKDSAINSRILKYKTSLEMIKNNFLFGSGIGTFKINYLIYQANYINRNPFYIKYSNRFTEAHNEYLQIFVELGIIGLLGFILIFIYIYKIIILYIKKNNSKKDKIIVFSMMMGATCFLIHSLFTFPLHVPALGTLFFTIIGLTIAYTNQNNLNIVCIKKVTFRKDFFINNKIKYLCIFLIIILMIIIINTIAIKPYIAEIYYFKGMEDSIYKKDYEKSLVNFELAAHLDPYNGRILHELGTTYYILSNLAEAENILERSKKYISDASTFYNLGLVNSKLGNLKEAEDEFKMAIYLNPKYIKAFNHLYWLYYNNKFYNKAIEQSEKLLERLPNFSEKYTILYYIGIAYQKKEMPDKALKYFLQALELAPEGSPIIEEIEEEIYNIYRSNLDK